MSILKDFQSGVALYGLKTVLFAIVPYVALRPFRRRVSLDEQTVTFDRTHGTDTSAAVEVKDLEFENPDEAIRYHATPVSVLDAAFDALPIRKSEFVFVDLGSGKGRTLLVAARSFKRALGVEYSKKLVTIAETNRATYAARQAPLAPIDVVETDIRDFEFPAEDLVVFSYESFWGPPMVECLRRLDDTRKRSGKRAWFIWVTHIPMIPRAMRDAAFLRLHARRPPLCGDWYAFLFECRDNEG